MLLKYNTMCTQNSYHKICEECGKEFITLMPTTHYCSDRCSKLAYKHRKRDERLNNTTLEVRERQKLALLDKDFLTLSDAARLMQMSRNTLYKKIIRDNEIQLKRFTDRTVRIARADLDKASESRSTGINTTAPGMTDNLGKWMTREQVMEKSVMLPVSAAGNEQHTKDSNGNTQITKRLYDRKLYLYRHICL